MTELRNFKHCKYYKLESKLIKVNEKNSNDFHHTLEPSSKQLTVKFQYVTTIS